MVTTTTDPLPLAILEEQIDQALTGYTEAMLWANASCAVESCEQGREIGECEHTLEAHQSYDLDDFSEADQRELRRDVEAIILDNLTDFRDYLDQRQVNQSDGSVAAHFGHDFALTRNGHGAGFWDRGLGELGDRLSEASRPYGESHVYVGEGTVSL